jgi:hypothetical protein
MHAANGQSRRGKTPEAQAGRHHKPAKPIKWIKQFSDPKTGNYDPDYTPLSRVGGRRQCALRHASHCCLSFVSIAIAHAFLHDVAAASALRPAVQPVVLLMPLPCFISLGSFWVSLWAAMPALQTAAHCFISHGMFG